MATLLESLMNLARKQVRNVTEFLTAPKGVFETIDQVIKDTRETIQNLRRRVTTSKLLRE